MAIYSCNISNVSRAKGSSACATLSYISGERVKDERRGETYNYGHKDRVMANGLFVPEQARARYQTASQLFNAIEMYETSDNARTAKKLMVAVPREFDLRTQIMVAENYGIENILSKGYAFAYSIHWDKDHKNPHIHYLIANRQIDPSGEWAKKRKMVYKLDEYGKRVPRLNEAGEQITDAHGRKQWVRINAEVNPLDTKEFLEELRAGWAQECNKYLAPEQQIDHRSYADRDIAQIPTVHEGYTARKIEKQGGTSERCEDNRRIFTTQNGLLANILAQLMELLNAIQAEYKKEKRRSGWER